jgi:hypothetical protein
MPAISADSALARGETLDNCILPSGGNKNALPRQTRDSARMLLNRIGISR